MKSNSKNTTTVAKCCRICYRKRMRIFILLAMLSCTSQQVTESTSQETEQPNQAKTPPTTVPKGRIGGSPILSTPIVIGGIATEDIHREIENHQSAIDQCYKTAQAQNTSLAGKVLVQLVIKADGSVADATTKATSLRHKPTEDCINEALSKASFSKLLSGRYAMVKYPFEFKANP